MANYFALPLQGAVFNLYAHSFLSFGLDQANAREKRGVVDAGSAVSPCLPLNFTLPFEGVNITGSSDPAACAASALELLDKDAACWNQDECSVSGVYQPPVNDVQTVFYAFSAYAAVFSSLGLGENTTLQELREYSDRICAMDYETLDAELGPNEFLDTLCFSATYIYELLHDGYGFGVDSTYIRFVGEVDGTDMGWALGAILYQANLLPWSLPACNDSYAKGTVDAIVGGLSVSLAVLAVVLVVVACKYADLVCFPRDRICSGCMFQQRGYFSSVYR